MNITIVTGPFFSTPPAPCGAVEMRWNAVAQRLGELGHEIVVITRMHPSQQRDETIGGVRYIRRGGFTRSGRLAIDLVKDFAHSVRVLGVLPAADILVTNTFWLPTLAPYVRSDAGRVVVSLGRMPKGYIRLYRGAARLSAVSQAVADAVVAEAPHAALRVRVISNSIDTDAFTPPVSPRDRTGEQTIIYTGRVHPEKGLDLLIAAFARLYAENDAVRLRIVGPWRTESGGGGERHRKRLRKMAEGLPVAFDEPIYEAGALADALRAAHVFCYPSVAERGETFGVAPLEAMATGLPAVVSDLACFRDFVEPGTTGLVFDHRADDAVEQLAGQLQRLLDDPAMAQSIGDAAAAKARQFSVANIADRYLEDWRTLIESPNGA